jgi:3-oxoacyl-[acyl-carrier-protein] synthase-3
MSEKKFRVRIAGVGHYVPPDVVKSEELEKRLSLPKGWIEMHCGVKERHFEEKGEIPSNLAVKASQQALSSAGMCIDDIDLIIFTSTCRDRAIPSTAAIIQYKLGAKKYIPTFDLNSVCVSFLMGFDISRVYIENGIYKNVLVVSAELCSQVLNWKDRNSAILFGDASAAAILAPALPSQKSNVVFSYFATDGSKKDDIIIKGFGLEYHPHKTINQPELNMFEMKGLNTFKNTIEVANLLFDTLLKESKFDKEGFQMVIPHQANLVGLRKFMRRVAIPPEKYYINIDRYGNTASASVPLALSEVVNKGIIKRDDRIILAAVGAGFSWGGICLIY